MASTMNKIVVEGIPQLVKQFPEILGDIMEAANTAAKEAMRPALAHAKATTRWKDHTGRLRPALTVFMIDQPKKGKTRVWATLGVPQSAGLQYYIPLELGHQVLRGKRGSRDANNTKKDYDARNTGGSAKATNFLYEAYRHVAKNAEVKIESAINRVLAKYASDDFRGYYFKKPPG